MHKSEFNAQLLGGEADFPFKLLVVSRALAEARTPVFHNTDYKYCTIEFVYEGRGHLEIDGESFTVCPNSVYFLQKHSENKYWHDKADPWKKIFLNIDGEFMEYLFRIYRMERVHHIADCPQLRKYFEEMLQIRRGSEGADRRAAIIFHRLLDECHGLLHSSAADSCPGELLELKKQLDRSLQEKFVLESFCRKLHRSSAHMIRCFKEEFGVTPYDYLMQKRMGDACMMLRYSNFSIKEIAVRLRFSDQYYFSNYFKRKLGASPQRYRTDSVSGQKN